MRVSKYTPILASLSLTFASGTPAVAQVHNMPRIEMQSTSINLGVGGQSGNGILQLPNLGTNCAYPFKVDSIGAGPQFGVSRVSAFGEVKNMTTIEDLSGEYNATQGEATLIGSAGTISMKNRANNVGLLRLYSRYGPSDRSATQSATQGDLCHEAPVPPVTQRNRSSASGPIDNYPGGTLLH